MKKPTAIHFTAKELLNPANPITVNVIGAGGTGHRMLTEMVRMHSSLIALGKPGLHVNLFDDDIVTEANLGRQLFAPSEVGLCKAVCLINRVNISQGTNWKAVTERFGTQTLHLLPAMGRANIYISCVDTAAARIDIDSALRKTAIGSKHDRGRPYYWMDCGNSRYTGQLILSTLTEIKQPSSEKYRPRSHSAQGHRRVPRTTGSHGRPRGTQLLAGRSPPQTGSVHQCRHCPLWCRTLLATAHRGHDRVPGHIRRHQEIQNHTTQNCLITTAMTIIDLDNKPIEVTDLELAIMQADDYRHYRVDDPSEYQLHLYAYWEDIYQKLLVLAAQ